jgi:anti-sigma B factor antagonist
MTGQGETETSFAVSSAELNGATVIRVVGEVDMETCDDVRTELIRCMIHRTGSGPLVLDLRGVTIFATIGLSLLIEARHRTERRGIGFAVAADRAPVLRPLAETGVGDLFVLRATVCEAVQAALVGAPARPPALADDDPAAGQTASEPA